MARRRGGGRAARGLRHGAGEPVTAPVRAHTVAAPAVSIRTRALALAWRLVRDLSLPPGTRTVHLAKLPWPLNQPQAPLQPGWVGFTETLEAPATPASEWTGLLARTPLRDIGSLTPGATVGTILQAPAPGLDVAVFTVALVRLSHGTILVDVRAEAAWLPARTPVEHLDPAVYRSVTISGQPWQSRARTRTFTAQADIARLTAIINRGVPAPPSVVGGMSCAPLAIVYTLRFTPYAVGGPAVIVPLGGCPHAYGITVNGRQQPSLWDNGALRTAAGSLLGIRYPLGV